MNNFESLPSTDRLVFTQADIAAFQDCARAISPSWGATHASDEAVLSDAVYVGALSGRSDLFAAMDTYLVYRISPDELAVCNMREGDAVIGTFRTVAKAAEAMKTHAAAIRY